MSGHSKWSQIKRAKGIADQKRGLAFTKLSTLIRVAVREGGGQGDPEQNFRVKMIIDRAKEANMPKENIKRAIDSAVIDGGKSAQEMIYEAIGPMGTKMIIVANTDNPNRTVASVRRCIEKSGNKLGAGGALIHFFKKSLEVTLSKELTEEEIFEFCSALGGDYYLAFENWVLQFPFENGRLIKDLTQMKPISIKTKYIPQAPIELDDLSLAKVAGLISEVEDLDDVVEVHTDILE